MFDLALTYLLQQDSLTAIVYLNQQEPPLEVVKVYQQLIRHLYWQEKNLPALMVLAQAGLQHALTVEATLPPEAANALKSVAKGLAYDLASFTWPGWAEPGINIDPTALWVGLDTAKINLRLAQELQKDELPMSRAYWMLGGQQLANGQLEMAEASFTQAESYAAAAGVEAERLLARAFILLSQRVAAPADPAEGAQLAAIKQQLETLENGPLFINQINTAWQVFAQAEPPPVQWVERPWGSFKQYAHNQAVTVSLMSVKPGQRLSLQAHTGRAELWIALDAGALVQVEDDLSQPQPGDEIWIPTHARHRLSSSGPAVRVLEVAFGNWQQADIIRYDDDYQRPAQGE